MIRVSASSESSSEFSRIEKKLTDFEIKINNLFKRILALTSASGIITSLLVIGSVTFILLAAITIAATGNPIHGTLVKLSLIFGATFGIGAFALMFFVILRSHNIIKNNPL